MQSYKKLYKLGEGEYGKVYKVERISDGKLFAMKTYTSDTPDINEIDILCTFKHPNMLYCVDCFYDTKDGLCVILPLAEYDLQEYITQKHPSGLSIGKCKSVLFQLASAVQFMHTNNIYHCDIKPQNILLYNNEIMLADFGMSFLNLQGKGMRCGTLGYASPQTSSQLKESMQDYPVEDEEYSEDDEYAEDEEESDTEKYKKLLFLTQQQGNEYFLSDIFAIGLVLLFCLTGDVLTYSYEDAWRDYANAENFVAMRLDSKRDDITNPSELSDFDKMANICTEACRLSLDERTASIKQILGSDLFAGDQPINGRIEQISLHAIPETICNTNFDQVISGEFQWMNRQLEVSKTSNPILVLNLALEIFIRSSSLCKANNNARLYACVAWFCADYTINSNARLTYEHLSKITDYQVSPKEVDIAVKQVIGHLKGCMLSNTFASEHTTNAYATLYYLYHVLQSPTKYLSMNHRTTYDEYRTSGFYRNEALATSDITKFLIQLNNKEVTISTRDRQDIIVKMD